MSSHSLLRIAVLAFVAAGATACATASPSGQPEPGGQPAPAARLLADAVLLLPVNEVTIEGPSPVSRDSAQAVGAAFDAEFQRVLAPDASPGWMWPDAVRALHRRNPLNVPDPTRLATRELRGSRLAVGEIVSAELGSQLRGLLAVAGARRYVLLPMRLHAGPASPGGYAGGVTLVAVDTRRSMIAGVNNVAVRIDARSGEQMTTDAIVRLVADAARTELAGLEAR
jgi:hypothetical protein